ncbi:MAG: hypothetical protein H6R19_91 [Proteobacteria bacterium]|nr:hypothetical protein [Pseudomonadota bacterium]
MSHAKLFWWISSVVERKVLYWAWALFCALGLMLIGFLLNLSRYGDWALGGYAVIAGVTVIAFRSVSCELGQLARNEALRVLPGFASSLLRGVWLCFALLLSVGAILSLGLKSWLPVITVAYAAAVAACLILPVSTSQRFAASDRMRLQQLGADNITWAAMLTLFLPAPALRYLPEMWVFGGMLGLALVMLLALPHRLVCMTGKLPAACSHSVWSQPSLAVFGSALVLVVLPFLPVWNSGRSSTLMFMAIPWMGLTALGREAAALRALLGRSWLSGMDRRHLCLHSIGRLCVAMAKELSIYLCILLAGYVFGMTSLEQLTSAITMVLTFGLVNGFNGIEEILHGLPVNQSSKSSLRVILKFLIVMAPSVVIGVMLIAKHPFGVYGLAALLSLVVALIWWVRDHLRRFETVELW